MNKNEEFDESTYYMYTINNKNKRYWIEKQYEFELYNLRTKILKLEVELKREKKWRNIDNENEIYIFGLVCKIRDMLHIYSFYKHKKGKMPLSRIVKNPHKKFFISNLIDEMHYVVRYIDVCKKKGSSKSEIKFREHECSYIKNILYPFFKIKIFEEFAIESEENKIFMKHEFIQYSLKSYNVEILECLRKEVLEIISWLSEK